MNTVLSTGLKFLILLAGNMVFLSSCLDTKVPRDAAAGPNLGFEFSQKGLPVNWILYEPPHLDYSISLDTNSPKEGKYALRFDVLKDSEEGNINFTGLTNEFPELTKSGGRYRISFWMKNKGTRYRISAGGTNAKESVKDPALIEDSLTFPDWKKMEMETEIPADMWLRFEIRLKGQGSFQIDQLEIKKL